MSEGFQTPVLFVAYHRTDLAPVLMDRIREVRPAKLFIAMDGPKSDVPGDDLAVAEVRRIIEEKIDWPCEVQRRYGDKNQGCKVNVAGAIDWFFEHVEAGIIIEDDTLADVSFFSFAEELLNRYADDSEVMHIGGTHYLEPHLRPESYYFSKYNTIWGWATWRRAWQHYDMWISDWPEIVKSGVLAEHFPDPTERELWEGRWGRIYEGKGQDDWDYQWFLICLLRGKAIIPTANLVTNLGFRADATHTADPGHEFAALACDELTWPLTHPATKDRDRDLDERIFEQLVARAPFVQEMRRLNQAAGR
ncbi:hypothetical protein ACWFRJ_34795 [Streptomyces sp. NPDC055239]